MEEGMDDAEKTNTLEGVYFSGFFPYGILNIN